MNTIYLTLFLVALAAFLVAFWRTILLERKKMFAERKTNAGDEFQRGLFMVYVNKFRKELEWRRGTLQFLAILFFIPVAGVRGAYADIAAWALLLIYLWLCSATRFAIRTQQGEKISRTRIFLHEVHAQWPTIIVVIAVLWLADAFVWGEYFHTR